MVVEEDIEKLGDDKVVGERRGRSSSSSILSPTPPQLPPIDPPPSDSKAEAGPAASDIDPPPNGGTVAWLQVLGSFFLFFSSWGIVNTFGVFQTYYETALLEHESPSNISWIGSIQAFLLLIIGTVTGPLYDAGYFRTLLFTGVALISIGWMMTSLCTSYYQIILAQAVCQGLGAGCIFIPSVAVLPQWFSSRKALVNGIAATGSSLGGIILPIVFRKLQPRIGFPWTIRVMGFISFATLLVPLCVMKVRVMPKQKRKLIQLSAFREPAFALYCIGQFVAFIGFYGPLFYVQVYAIQEKIMSDNLAFYLLPILNSASIFGRVVPNLLADRTGPLNVLIPATFATAILALCWIGIRNTPGLIAFAILYGFFSGGFVSLPPVTLVSLTPDLRDLGTRMSMCFSFTAFAQLVGTPLSGIILRRSGSYVGLQLFSGITVMCTACILIACRIAKNGTKLKVKV